MLFYYLLRIIQSSVCAKLAILANKSDINLLLLSLLSGVNPSTERMKNEIVPSAMQAMKREFISL